MSSVYDYDSIKVYSCMGGGFMWKHEHMKIKTMFNMTVAIVRLRKYQ